jgi:hypothetical protein
MDINVQFFAKLPGCPGDQLLFPVDQTGDVIGNPSGRKRGVGAAFEDRYGHLRPQPAHLRRGAHPGRIATYDYEHFFLLRKRGAYCANDFTDKMSSFFS